MKAVILEIRDELAAVMSDDGRIWKVKNHEYTVGQEIEMKKQITRSSRKLIAWAAAAAALVLTCGTGALAYYTPYSYVSLDVNPSIEFTLNRFDIVLCANPVNDDGQEILNGLPLDTLANLPIEQAISVTVDQISQEGYFDGEGGGGIVVATSAEDQEKADELAADLQENVEQETQENGDEVEVEVISVGYERVQKAKELGVTPGKLNLVEKLQASAADPASINIEEWLNKSVKEIMKATKENKKAAKAGTDTTDTTGDTGTTGDTDDTATPPVTTEPGTASSSAPTPAVTPTARQNGSDQAEKEQEREAERLRKEQEQQQRKEEQEKEKEKDKNNSGKKK